MAKSKDGFFGKLSGKIGNVVIASWRGIPYVRSRPSGNPSNTKAQQNQRTKFGMVVKFVGHILPVINAGFKWKTDEIPERNAAISYLMTNGVQSEKPDIRIDYPHIMVTRGQLPPPKGATVERADEHTLSFSWEYNQDLKSARHNDKVIALGYSPDLQKGVWTIGSAVRADENLQLELSDEISGQTVHTYLAFANIEGTDASDSVYLGDL